MLSFLKSSINCTSELVEQGREGLLALERELRDFNILGAFWEIFHLDLRDLGYRRQKLKEVLEVCVFIGRRRCINIQFILIFDSPF